MGMTKRLLAAGFTIIATHAFAQLPIDGVHYPAGLHGIKAGIPDAPGIYVRDDNWFYTGSASQPAGYNTFVYMQAPQLMWLTDWKIIGANIGADAMVPFIWKETSYNPPVSSLPGGGFPVSSTSHSGQFGVGDIKIEPFLMAWHWDEVDMMAAGAVWAPS